MIGPEDIQETPKTNYTPILILGIAALLLIIVGFMSYRDYVISKADEKVKVSDERIRALEDRIREFSDNKTGPQTPSAQNPPQNDPEIDDLRRQLAEMKSQSEAIKKRSEENSLKVDRMLQNGPSTDRPRVDIGAIPPPSGIRDDLTIPDYVRDSVETPPGGYQSPTATKALTEVERKIMNAPSIGKIISYNEDWNLVTINAGKSNGIEKGQRYAVRRGSQSLGIVKIFEAFPDQCNANIVTDNRKFEGALKPRAGDEIISYDPF